MRSLLILGDESHAESTLKEIMCVPSHVRHHDSANPWAVAHQAPLCMASAGAAAPRSCGVQPPQLLFVSFLYWCDVLQL